MNGPNVGLTPGTMAASNSNDAMMQPVPDYRETPRQKIGQLCNPCVSVGQDLWYFPTQSEMKKYNSGMDAPFACKIVKTNEDQTVNLLVYLPSPEEGLFMHISRKNIPYREAARTATFIENDSECQQRKRPYFDHMGETRWGRKVERQRQIDQDTAGPKRRVST